MQCQPLPHDDCAARLTDLSDVVDVHFMPSVLMADADRQAFEAVGPVS